MRTLLLTLITCLSVLPAHAKYGGGSGTAQDPYQIATAGDLIALGETPEDYVKHFILTADIDLDPNLPGRKVFDKAVIAPDMDPAKWDFQGTQFTGVFDGDGHTISNLQIKGGSHVGLFGCVASRAEVKDLSVADFDITASSVYVGGLLGYQSYANVTRCCSTGVVSGRSYVGGLVGCNANGRISQCYSTCVVSGGEHVGGLAGFNSGALALCYSTGAVSATNTVGRPPYAGGGGLVGINGGSITTCYSAGVLTGSGSVGGGLVGYNGYYASVNQCFWDTQTSGQIWSGGGTGKTTAEMQTAKTFLDAGWDFVGETANGTEDIWWILEGKDYPRLWWEAAKK